MLTTETNESDYVKYRGKCKEMSEQLVSEHSELRLVRGYYHCPIWGKQAHWWAEDPQSGRVVDPTCAQFPSKGMGHYEEFDGTIECEYCGKSVPETDAYMVGHHVYCCAEHYGRDVM